jgi:hypothetical protein
MLRPNQPHRRQSSAGTHLESTTGGGHRAPDPHPESLLVLYLDSQDELDAIAGRLIQAGVSRVQILLTLSKYGPTYMRVTAT